MRSNYDKQNRMDMPMVPLAPAQVRSAALTVAEICGPDRSAVGETLAMLGIDAPSLERGIFYEGSGGAR